MVTKIQKERKDLAKKGKLLTDEVATAAGIQVASNCSNGSAFHYHRQVARLVCMVYLVNESPTKKSSSANK